MGAGSAPAAASGSGTGASRRKWERTCCVSRVRSHRASMRRAAMFAPPCSADTNSRTHRRPHARTRTDAQTPDARAETRTQAGRQADTRRTRAPRAHTQCTTPAAQRQRVGRGCMRRAAFTTYTAAPAARSAVAHTRSCPRLRPPRTRERASAEASTAARAHCLLRSAFSRCSVASASDGAEQGGCGPVFVEARYPARLGTPLRGARQARPV